MAEAGKAIEEEMALSNVTKAISRDGTMKIDA